MKYYIYPPDVTPAHGYNVHRSALEWVKRAYKKNGKWKKTVSKDDQGNLPPPAQKQRGGIAPPQECMQRAGDVLYIPSGW